MNWTLLGFGSLEWETIRQRIGGVTCIWADYSGIRRGECPPAAPPYSHLWGWNEDGCALYRVRIAGDRGILGVLSQERDTPSGSLTSEAVEVRSLPGIPWGDDGRIAPLPHEALAGQFYLHEVLRPLPVTFVSVRTAEAQVT